MNKFNFLLILLFILPLFTFAQNQSDTSATTESSLNQWKIHTTDEFEIQYPPNWELNTSGQMGTSFILFSPLEDEQDQFKDNINLLIQDLTGYNLDLDQYVKISEEQVMTMFKGSKFIVNERQQGESHEFHEFIYEGKQGIFDLKFKQYFWVIGEKAWILTFTCEQSKFEEYQANGELILNSFKLK